MVNLLFITIHKNLKKYFKLLTIILIYFFLLLFPHESKSYDNIDFILRNYKINNPINKNIEPVTNGRTNELGYLGLGFIRFYQLVISSQDEPVCNFTLSCSHFGMEAIKYNGFFWGILLTADRLTRCNSLTKKEYLLDPENDLAIDNVQFYYFTR
jgi:putative component of membrane protein insertase Oxa1/YidC/SpoIIIJ protein YidD